MRRPADLIGVAVSAAETSGVEFPMIADRRSSATAGREAFARAAGVIDPRMARRIRAVKDWRGDYVRPARDLVAIAGRRPEDALAASTAGLAYLHDRFVFLRRGAEYPLGQAFELPGDLGTRTFAGSGPSTPSVSVPYRGREFEGSDLRLQVRRWVGAGVAEPSLGDAVGAAIDHPEWFDLRDTTVVVLGAGAELSPLRPLLSWGATVVAVDLPRPDAWRRIIDAVSGTPGVVQVPVPLGSGVGDDASEVAEVAGVDLLRQLPHVAAWLRGFDGDLVLANYLYADGALNVRLSMAADALGQHLIAERGKGTALAFLATPTDAFQVGPDVVAQSRARWEHALLARATRLPLRPVNLFQPNYSETLTDAAGREYGVADCIVPQQGPNYLLAKRMQRWRATVARTQGVRVSLNVAPATRTQSVVKNRLLAAAYAGASRFGMEIFEPATTNALMAALLVRDLKDPASAANPQVLLAHPARAFSEAAMHGGLWRVAYSPRSVLGVAAVLGMIERSA